MDASSLVPVSLQTPDIAVQNTSLNVTQQMDRIENDPSSTEIKPNFKPLDPNILKDAGKFIENFSAKGQSDPVQGAGNRDKTSTLSNGSSATPQGASTPDMDRQLARLKNAADYAGYLSATVSLVSTGMASFKQLQQG